MANLQIALLVGLVLCSSAACSQKPAPLFASSADQASYAERYPTTLAALRTRYAEDEKLAREKIGKFSGYADELGNTDYEHVAEMAKRADAAGKSGDFVKGMEEANAVQRFYDEEKTALQQKVGGSVNYAAKEKHCDADLYGSAAAALDKAIEKQLEERLRQHNEAHRYIEDHQDALGKANLEKLQKQADDIALASYIANVRLKQHKLELEAMIEEGSAVQRTLERTVEEANAVLQDPNASKTAKDLAKKRADTASEAKTVTEVELQQAEAAVKEIEPRISQMEADYKKAFDDMIGSFEFKAKMASSSQ